jgi:recombination endonuclease VII
MNSGFFHVDRKMLCGFMSICKLCNNALHAIYRLSNKETRAAYQRKYRAKEPYRLKLCESRSNAKRCGYAPLSSSPEELKAFIEAHGEACGMLGCADNWEHIDHDHETGKLRGLLCLRHNAGLGQFRDSAVELLAAIKYLHGA